ncbi:MAG: DUF1186 domain-containing protein [Comamonadaceae bacterium]|nr:DUF1186 domain-containing protein [Comamonadaceae bacterium]
MTENWNHLKAQLEFFSTPFPQEAIDFANLHRDELAPFLVEVLTQVSAKPSLAMQEDYVLHQYAMHLLACWRDERAYAPLLALGRLDDSVLDAVLGDALTESYGRCLAGVCGGDTGPIKALIESMEVDFWVRHAAVHALVVRVLEGDDDRTALLAYLAALGENEAARIGDPSYVSECDELIDCLVQAAADLVAVELRDVVERWYDAGLINRSWLSREDFNTRLANSYEATRAQQLARDQGYVTNVKTEIGGWSGFHERVSPVAAESDLGSPASELTRPLPPKSWSPTPVETFVRETPKVGRNDLCPCGSGKKYKKCCG